MRPSTTARPLLTIAALDIRRDIVKGFEYFSYFHPRIVYAHNPYDDLYADEYGPDMLPAANFRDMCQKLWQTPPALLQLFEPFSLRYLPQLLILTALARRRHTPIFLVTFENHPLACHGRLGEWLLRVGLPPLFSAARLIIYLNDGARRNVLSCGPYANKLSRHMYGTWGVDLNEFSPAANGLEPPLPTILFVGRLHPQKGIFDLLTAFGLVSAQIPAAQLIFVGDGPARNELAQEISARGWTDRVHLAGKLYNRDLPPVFRNATVFCAPSVTDVRWEEQVGMTNIQAMACGLPVVSTLSGAIPEYVPDGVAGILTPEHDPAALAQALIRLLTDSDLRRQMGQAGRRYAVEHYDIAGNVRAVENVLRQALTTGGTA